MPEDPLFPPPPSVGVPDVDARLAKAATEIRRRKRRRAGAAAGSLAIGAAAVAVVLPLSLSHSSSAPDVATLTTATPTVSTGPSGSAQPSPSHSPSASNTSPADPTSTAPATSEPVLPPASNPRISVPLTAPPTTSGPSTSPTPTGPPATGTVTDAAGTPLAGMYVIGLHDFTTVRTNTRGQFSLPCSGSGQPIVVADWDIPLLHPNSVDESKGVGANDYTMPTSSPDVGTSYVFGPAGTTVTTADQAPVLSCGTATSYVLPTGGRVVITFTSPSGKPPPPRSSSSVKLPSLGSYTFYATLPVSNQVSLPGLPAGDVTFASTYPATSDCSGPGVTYDGDFIFTVPVVAGETTTLSCTLPQGD